LYVYNTYSFPQVGEETSGWSFHKQQQSVKMALPRSASSQIGVIQTVGSLALVAASVALGVSADQKRERLHCSPLSDTAVPIEPDSRFATLWP
jgi:hypothetical protein